ncbi:MAG: glutathione peroxidase, partial [Shewanella sp.]|nr:glutathione peroxidase [Shewanella sp.]
MYNSVYDFEVTDIIGKTVNLSRYKGNVLLIVNTASKCGFTPQYEGLEQLYQKYAAQGLVILGFPCNQFGSQEPGDNERDYKIFCVNGCLSQRYTLTVHDHKLRHGRLPISQWHCPLFRNLVQSQIQQ